MRAPKSKRRRLLVSLVLIALLLTAFAFTFNQTRAPDPLYEGKPLSAWLTAYGPNTALTWPRKSHPSDAAIQALGTNCFPAIIARLRVRDSFAKRQLIRLARTLRLPIKISSQYRAHAEALAALGTLRTTAIPIIPHLADAVGTMDLGHQINAGFWLSSLGPDAEGAIPAFLKIVTNQAELHGRPYAVSTLSEIGARRRDLILPILQQALTDPNWAVRQQAAAELTRNQWDTNNPYASPPDYNETNLLQLASTNPSEQIAATYYFSSQPILASNVVPHLITNIASTNTQLLEITAKALAAYGPAAQNALPELTNLLTHPKKHVRNAASNAITRINAQPMQH
ncbi:MAG TPA: hypothetical protein VF773_03225 [Verrucomicrobiae bacterium]